MKSDLWPHQQQSVDFFLARPRGNDFSDPGTGKTRVQIELLKRRKNPGRALVVCPKTLMYSAWGADIEKFGGGMTFSLAPASKRERGFELKSDVVIINSDGVTWLAEHPAYLRGFDHLIIDEVTTFKHGGQTKRTKAMNKLRRSFTHRYALTGTPNANSVTELFYPMLIIDDGQRLGTSFYQFRGAVQVATQIGPMANMVKWNDRPGAEQAVDELIADITMRHSFDDVMTSVPEHARHTVTFELPPAALKAYKAMQETAMTVLKDATITAVHAASVRTKLLQIASGAVYDGEHHYAAVNSDRYELIADLVMERQQSIVAFNWKHQRDFLKASLDKRRCTYAVLDGDTPDHEVAQIVKDYQAGRYQTLLLHPKTAAHGLTLTKGTTVIISSPIYEADLLKQIEHRVHRGGQTQSTETIMVCAKDTVDELVYERLFDKTKRMMTFLELIESRS